MAYGTIDVGTWGDARFRGLSAPKPNAQTLWLYLLSGPHRTTAPGLFHMGQAGLAESLGWSVSSLKRCWSELESAGMAKADWVARLIWLPKAPAHNPPSNESVVRGWRRSLESMPQCALRNEAEQAMREYLAENKQSIAYAFEIGRGRAIVATENEQNQDDAKWTPCTPPCTPPCETPCGTPLTRVRARVARGPDQTTPDQTTPRERGFTTTTSSPPPQPPGPSGPGRSRRLGPAMPDPAEASDDAPAPKAVELGRLAHGLELAIMTSYVQAHKHVHVLDGWGMTPSEIRAAIEATPPGKQDPWKWAEHVHRQHRDAKTGNIA